MDKNEAIKAIENIAADKNFLPDYIVKKCTGMAENMTTAPFVCPIIDDELYGTGIAFDYNVDENGFFVEISVTDEGVWGYVCYCDANESSFAFESENDAVNFWNVVVGKMAVKGKILYCAEICEIGEVIKCR